MKKLIIPLFLTFAFHSCLNDTQTKVNYEDENLKDSLIIDSTLTKISDLPIQIDSVDYLIYPIGNAKISSNSRGSFYLGSGGSGSSSFSVSNSSYGNNSGIFYNLKFQKVHSDSLIALTDKTLRINSFTFLREIFESTGRKFLLYQIHDRDTNKDRVIDRNDIETLYISEIDGSKFEKIIPDFQELIDWKTVKKQNRLYYRSIEDVDKDGEFTTKDSLHYFYIDLGKPNMDIIEFNPL